MRSGLSAGEVGMRHGPMGTEMETKAIEMGKSGTGARIMSPTYDSVQDKRKRVAHRWKEVATVLQKVPDK